MTDWIVITAVASVSVAIICLGIAAHAAASLIKCQHEKGQADER